MKILQLTPQIPFPLSEGGKVGIYNITKHVAMRGHEITMLALDVHKPIETAPLEQYCELIRVPHSNKNSIVGAAQNLWSPLPYNIWKYRSKLYREALNQLLETRTFDVVHVDHAHMGFHGVYCQERFGLPIVLREHDVATVIMDRFAESVKSPLLRTWLSVQQKRMRRYEAGIAGAFDCCCAITNEDEKRLQMLSPHARLRVVPGGVDAKYFEGETPEPPIPYSMSYFGYFGWPPNVDAVIWFIDEILPKIVARYADAKLFVIGRNAPRRLEARQNKNVVLRGFVPDLKEEIQRYELTLVPIRIGGGIRLKILESFAMRVPVVSTHIGCEGIEASDGEHLLIGDDPQTFAAQVMRLFDDRVLRDRLIANAYRLASGKYRWERVAMLFEDAYNEAIASRARRKAGSVDS
jgi:glycosyltransferase involved in cell wall biosynthesis